MKIGFTERGDAGLDTRWFERVKTHDCDGLVAITKNLTDDCCEKLLRLTASGFPVVLHAGITGIPKSVEPGTPDTRTSMNRLRLLVDNGFPADRIVLRIDPIVPVGKGFDYVGTVLQSTHDHGFLPGLRVRVSVLDNYPHVRARFENRFGPDGVLYGGNWNPPASAFAQLTEFLRQYVDLGWVERFETCAESGNLSDTSVFCHQGCLSVNDLLAMGLDPDKAPSTVNGQNRGGCLCLTCKHELLDCRHPCGNKCLYCYWKD